jgi:hypothetical protein
MSVKLADTAPYMRGKEDKKEASPSYHGILCAVVDREFNICVVGRVSNFEFVHIFVPYNQPVR